MNHPGAPRHAAAELFPSPAIRFLETPPGLTYDQPAMEKTNKNILTDLQAYDTASLKARLGELRRYL